MTEKSEFVDMISDATRQRTRLFPPRAIEPAVKERSRLSHWPPQRWADWRMEKLTPWKVKSWNTDD